MRLAPPPVSVDPLPADWCPSEPLSPEIAVAEPDLSDTVPETDAEPESEPLPLTVIAVAAAPALRPWLSLTAAASRRG